tara:strand:+ start:1821 stop:2726 length:906 start_codon:yes stop_codon:yes gene_type:complete
MAACGARREVLDIGANDGRALATLRHLPPRVGLTGVTAWEMNPIFAAVLTASLARLPGGELKQLAAWTNDQGVEVQLQLPGLDTAHERRAVGLPDNATGSSVVLDGSPVNRESKCGLHAWCSSGQRRVRVPSIDLAQWLQNRFCAADLVVMKLDVEGAEYELLEHLVERGAMGLVDWLAVEWHLGQRAPRKGSKREQLERRQERLEHQLKKMGVRRFVWENLAAPTSAVTMGLMGTSSAPPDPVVVANTTADPSDSCVGSARFSRCCKRHPKATGCRRGHRAGAVPVRSGYGRHSASRAFV